MLRKLAALVLAAGLCLPYGCSVRPLTGVWSEPQTAVFLGIPVFLAAGYVLYGLLPPVAEFVERRGQALHGILRVLYFGLAGGYLALAVTRSDNWPNPIDAGVALLVTGGLLVWQQGRGTKAVRVPLLLLLGLGVAHLAWFTGFLREGGLQAGGWVMTAGWLLGVVADARILAVAPRVAHSG